MIAYLTTWNSPVGPLHLIADDEALICLAFDANLDTCRKRLGLGELAERENPVIKEAKEQLLEYFAGRRREFSVPIKARGTEFQKKAWEALQKIAYGQTVSYQAQARELGQSGAIRATGSANGRNPIAIIVPCHRVVRSDGAIGGYAGGIEVKAKLLALESRVTEQPALP